jgi:hypothetical protein
MSTGGSRSRRSQSAIKSARSPSTHGFPETGGLQAQAKFRITGGID